MCSSLTDAISKHIEAQNQASWQRSVRAFEAELDAAQPRVHLRLKKGYLADVELQPLRWLRAGTDIIESANVVSRAKNFDGSDGAIMQAVLPYWVFAGGAELFLKGMLLCRHKPCRALHQTAYMDKDTCDYFEEKIRRYSHNLIALIRANQKVARYRRDPVVRRFLKRLSALVRLYYYPVFVASRVAWANSRYPKRFFNDAAAEAKADSWVRLPDQRLVASLFEGMTAHIDDLWGITRGFLKENRTALKRRKKEK